MENTLRIINDTKGIEAFRVLLRESTLPADDLNPQQSVMVGYYEGDRLIGTGAIEIHAPFALLRSIAVAADMRGKSVGSKIVGYLLKEAKDKHLQAVYLLTETAESYFGVRGFVKVNREQAPDSIKRSSEFAHVCPSSAAVMMIDFERLER